MTGDLFINGIDAYSLGVTMCDGFIDALLSYAPMKEYIKNTSRVCDGQEIINKNPKIDERTVSLTFGIEGSDMKVYLYNLKAFYSEIKKGLVRISIPSLGSEVYNLYYSKPMSFNGNVNKTFSKVTLQFVEPNPSNR